MLTRFRIRDDQEGLLHLLRNFGGQERCALLSVTCRVRQRDDKVTQRRWWPVTLRVPSLNEDVCLESKYNRSFYNDAR